MSSPSYSELLKHPEWQKKRLEILQEHNFTCEMCFCDDKTLHVHHIQYKKGKKPWEYEKQNFMVLCEEFHVLQSGYQSDCLKYINQIFQNIDEDDREWFQDTLRALSEFIYAKKLLFNRQINEHFIKRKEEEKE